MPGFKSTSATNLPAYASDDGIGDWVPATHVRTVNSVSSSWFQHGPALTTEAIHPGNQQTENDFLSVSKVTQIFNEAT